MAVVNIVIPQLKRNVFSGGILCIFEYAKGLTARGHEVNLVPVLPSPEPQWFSGPYGRLMKGALKSESNGTSRAIGSKARVRELVANLATKFARFFPHEIQRGFYLRQVRELVPHADVTVATSYETALPVHLYGSGRRCYFMQHFEPFFAVDMPDARLAEHEAMASYSLGLHMIANSTWLQQILRSRVGVMSSVCLNAIDHDVFSGEPRYRELSDEVRVISYGGSHATWKGIADMATAVRQVRSELPNLRIRWQVFGSSLLAPKNEIADYEPLGFLQPRELAEAYRQADVLLSASWYESFPLFPLEAMACGLPVITTQPGTEDYAIHESSAEIVEPRDVAAIARGLRRVIEQADYRRHLAMRGPVVAKEFSWAKSSARMESLLLAKPDEPSLADVRRND